MCVLCHHHVHDFSISSSLVCYARAPSHMLPLSGAPVSAYTLLIRIYTFNSAFALLLFPHLCFSERVLRTPVHAPSPSIRFSFARSLVRFVSSSLSSLFLSLSHSLLSLSLSSFLLSLSFTCSNWLAGWITYALSLSLSFALSHLLARWRSCSLSLSLAFLFLFSLSLRSFWSLYLCLFLYLLFPVSVSLSVARLRVFSLPPLSSTFLRLPPKIPTFLFFLCTCYRSKLDWVIRTGALRNTRFTFCEMCRFDVNSTQEKPKYVSDAYLSMLIAQMKQVSFSLTHAHTQPLLCARLTR